MAEHRINMTANFSQFDAEIKKAIGELKYFGTIASSSAGDSDKALAKFTRSLDYLNSNATTTKQRMNTMFTLMKEMELEYERMGEKGRNSAFGQGLQKNIERINKSLSRTKELMAKVNTTDTYGSATVAAAGAEVQTTGGGNLFGKIMGGNLAARAVMDSVRFLGRTMKEAVQANMEFEYSNATLAAVLGKSKEEISDLTDLARELGSTSLYSANEISQMQIVLARLGFKKEEINDATDAVAKLALATGDNLAKSATLTGSALRAFAYDASEANHVAAVLGVSTTKSALDMEKLRTSMSYVGAVAHQVGFDIEDTVAMLGKLVDRGIQATTAGVGIRNILLDLSKSNSKLSQTIKHVTGKENIRSLDEFLEALDQLRAAGINMEDVANMIQKRVTPSFLEMLANTKGIIELRDELRGCDSDLDVMAEKMQNTLSGAVKMMHNAWNGLMISFEESPGKLRNVVLAITNVIKKINELSNTGKLQNSINSTIIVIKALTVAYVTFNAKVIASKAWDAIVWGAAKAKAAMIALNTAFKANPFMFVASAVAAATVAIKGFVKQTEKERDALEDVNRLAKANHEINQKVKSDYDTQKSLIEMLNDAIHDESLSINERRNAIERLQGIVPNYHASLSDEGTLLEKNKNAINEYVMALEKKIRMEAYESKLTDLYKERADTGFDPQHKRTKESIEADLYSGKEGIDMSSMSATSRDSFIQRYIETTLSAQQVAEAEYNLITEVINGIIGKIKDDKLLETISIADNEGLEDGVQGTRGSGGGSAKDYLDRMLKAERKYATTLELASIDIENGIEDKKDYLKKELSATEQLYKAYSGLYEETKDPKYLEEMKGLAESIKCLRQEIDKQTELEKQSTKLTKQDNYELIKQKQLDRSILWGLNSAAQKAGWNSEMFGTTGIMPRIDLGIDITEKEWNKFVIKLNKKLKELGLDQITIDFETGKVQKAEEKYRSITGGIINPDEVSVMGSASALTSAVGQIANSLETLGVTVSEDFKQGLEKINAIITIINSLATIVSTIQGIAVALLVRKMIPLFHTGGIVHAANGYFVPGAKNGGIDTVPAMLSPGELVLNEAQQKNLASKLQGGGVSAMMANVVFELQGTKLIGVVNNTIKSKSGKRSNLIYQH